MSERQEAVIVAWAKHRAGVEQLGEDWPLSIGKALNLDRRAQGFLETFGKREFYGFVGFIDLCGFSTHTSSLSPKEVHDFAMRFLEPVIADISSFSPCIVPSLSTSRQRHGLPRDRRIDLLSSMVSGKRPRAVKTRSRFLGGGEALDPTIRTLILP